MVLGDLRNSQPISSPKDTQMWRFNLEKKSKGRLDGLRPVPQKEGKASVGPHRGFLEEMVCDVTSVILAEANEEKR